MKTITFRADDGFDAKLTGLAESLQTTKSSVIRAAIISYNEKLEREALARQIRAASLAVRDQAAEASVNMVRALRDGL